MWPFKKQQTEPSQAGEDKQSWTMYVVMIDNRPMVVRLLQSAKQAGIAQGLVHQVGVATPLNRPNEKGFHDADEGQQVGAIEDAITTAFEKDGRSQFVFSNVSKGAKEWVFYTKDPDYVKAEFLRIKDETLTHKLQLMIRTDADWRTYDAFVQLGSG